MNYFNTLPLREQLLQLGVCRFMDKAEFADDVKVLKGKKIVFVHIDTPFGKEPLPILQVLAISFTEPNVGLSNYERLVTAAGVQRVIGTTLRICLITTVCALALGYALSYVIALATPRAQRWWLAAVLLPFAASLALQLPAVAHGLPALAATAPHYYQLRR